MCSGTAWASLLIDQLPMPASTTYLGVMHSFEFSCQWKERPLVQLLQSTLRSPSFNLSRNLQWVICKNQAVPRRVRNPGETGSNKTIKFKSLKKTQLWKNRAGPLPYLSPSSWVLFSATLPTFIHVWAAFILHTLDMPCQGHLQPLFPDSHDVTKYIVCTWTEWGPEMPHQWPVFSHSS